MRSYGQYCAMARALDTIGDRWTLLIVRELWLRPCRYVDLKASLPGIATNLLTDRLRKLEAAGVVSRTEEPPPIATTVYGLTARGFDLAPLMRELVRWGDALMTAGQGEDFFKANWLGFAVEALMESVSVNEALTFAVHIDEDEPVLFQADPQQGVRSCLRESAQPSPDVTVAGPPQAVISVLAGRGDLQAVRVSGSKRAVQRLRKLLDQPRKPQPDRNLAERVAHP